MNRKRKKVAKKSANKADNQNVDDWKHYMDLKKRKLMDQYDHDKGLCTEQLSDIFKNVAIFVNGLTRPSAEELKLLMTRHGGVYHTYQMSSTTHIIASNLAHAKIKHIGSVPIVKPQWITESIDMQKLLDYRRYLLFTNQSTTQPRLQFPVIPKPNANSATVTKDTLQLVSTETEDLETNVKALVAKEAKVSETYDCPSCSIIGVPAESENEIEHSEGEDKSQNIFNSTFILDKQEHASFDVEKLSTCHSGNKHGETSKRATYFCESDEDIFGENSPQEQAKSIKSLPTPEVNNKSLDKENRNVITSEAKISSENNDRDLPMHVRKASSVSKQPVDDVWNNTSDDILGDISPPEQCQVNYPTSYQCPKPSETCANKEKDNATTSSVMSTGQVKAQQNDPPFQKASSEPLTSDTRVASNSDTRLQVQVNKSVDKSGINKPAVIDRSSNVAKTAADPSFLKEFYNNSRLHLISTLSAEFKQLVVEMRENSDGKFPGKEALIQKKLRGELPSDDSHSPTAETGPIIMHIDMDCFFVSVGLRTRPHLRGRPTAVTHGRPGRAPGGGRAPDALAELELRAEHSDRLASRSFDLARDAGASMSEVASCSYEARERGVRNGMFLGTALRLCPELQVMPYDFQGYREVSSTLYRTVAEYTLDVEAVSCDEMYVDCTKLLRDTGLSVGQWARHIREEIQQRTGCPCSTGLGPSRLLARLATRRAKPAGQYHVASGEAEAFLQAVPLAEVPGVGPAALAKLRDLGLATCGDVQLAGPAALAGALGRGPAERLSKLARGLDDRPMDFDHRRKTVSAEVNYGIRFNCVEEAYTFLKSLSQEVFDRADAIGMRAKCVTLKLLVRSADAPVQTAKYLGHGICDALTKSTTLNTVLPTAETIYREIKLTYDRLNPKFQDLRGIGIHLTKLEKNKGRTRTLMSFCKAKSSSSEPKVEALTETLTRQQGSDVSHRKSDQRKSGADERESSPVAGPSKLPTGSKIETPPVAGPSKLPTGSKVETAPVAGPSKLPTGSKIETVDNVRCASSEKGESSSLNKYKKVVESGPSTSYTGVIDFEVLRELPEEIRNEIIKEYKIEEIVEKQICEENENARTCNAGTSRPASRVYEAPEAQEPQSPFHTIPFEEVKSVVRNWTVVETEPGTVDTEMLGSFCKELAELRSIEQLKILMSFFYRILEAKDCKWHRAYFEVVNTAQQGMVARYGSTLLVKRTYKCCKHC